MSYNNDVDALFSQIHDQLIDSTASLPGLSKISAFVAEDKKKLPRAV